MRVVMMTNTFRPHVGGVARSIEAFTDELRARGHQVLVVAPEFSGMPESETDVVRIPALQRFNGSDFSFPVPAPAHLRDCLDDLRPQVLHSHHPFLLGDTALRIAAERDLPVVFTHHTMYERYTHYVPGDSPRMKRAAVELAVGYCNLCSAVIAPSESVAALLLDRGVTTPIEVVPTGVDLRRFGGGDGASFRARAGIPQEVFMVGHLGRLAPEKNIPLIGEAMALFLRQREDAHALVAGQGPACSVLLRTLEEAGVTERFHLVEERLDARRVADCYAAMDVFLFASTTETQGMVVTEAMAAGTPVVAIDASGVRDVVVDEENGLLVPVEAAEPLASALLRLADSVTERESLARGARATAERLSLPRTTEKLLQLYASLKADRIDEATVARSLWRKARARLEEEWRIVRNVGHALGETLRPGEP